jgi:hypothetical protein
VAAETSSVVAGRGIVVAVARLTRPSPAEPILEGVVVGPVSYQVEGIQASYPEEAVGIQAVRRCLEARSEGRKAVQPR